MSDLLKRIADYFANEYNGDDKTSPMMILSVEELRYIAQMNVERCRAEAELRELKNKRSSRTNADRIRSMSDEELAEHFSNLIADMREQEYCEDIEDWLKWLQSEVEE